MTDKRTQQMADQGNTEKSPEGRTTGDEGLTKAQAPLRIDELQQVTGRGQRRKDEKPRMAESGDAEADAHGGDVRGVSDRE